jgi:putative transposase
MDNVFIERLWRSLKYEDVYNRPPMQVWRDGVTGPIGNNAVDMMDNATALPTCPQQQKQKQTALFAA